MKTTRERDVMLSVDDDASGDVAELELAVAAAPNASPSASP